LLAGIDPSEPLPGGRRSQDLEGMIPDSAKWIAPNYEHLLGLTVSALQATL